jgi:hypothetical protein
VLGIALRILILLLTPVGGLSLPGRLCSYNDELAHGNYIEHLVSTGELPRNIEAIDAADALTRGVYENYQPPLYYLVAAGVCRILGIADVRGAVFMGRILNVILNIGLVATLFALGRSLQWSTNAISAGIVFVALSAVFVRFTCTAGNEVLFWLFAAAMIWGAIRLYRRPDEFKSWLLFVAWATLGIYTKLTAVLLLPLPLLAIPRSSRRLRCAGLALLAFAALLVFTLPIWVRNLREFGGLLPLAAGFGIPGWRFPGFASVIFAIRSFIFPWWEFWRGFVGLLFMLPAAAIFLDSAFRRDGFRRWRSSPVLILTLGLAAVSFLWLNLRYTQAEGRYLFSAWPALAVLAGGDSFSDRRLWLFMVVLLLPYSLMLFPAGG